MQKGYSRLWEGYGTDKEALSARNADAKKLRRKGYKILCFTLPNQMKKYDGIGQYNGSVCNVYMLQILAYPNNKIGTIPANW